MRGLFITFDGPDGAGKSTQLKRAADFLKSQHLDVQTTREPGGTPLGEVIREWLLSRRYEAMSSQTEVLLYAAARTQHISQTIGPHVARGGVLLCDRYVDASRAYQGYGNQLPVAWIEQVNRLAVQEWMPQRTYLLDVPVEVSINRLQGRRSQELDRIERRDREYHQRVREGFLAIAKADPQRVVCLDGTAPEEELAHLIREDLQVCLQAWMKQHNDGRANMSHLDACSPFHSRRDER